MINRTKWMEIIKDFHEKELPKTIERDIDIPLDTPINRAITLIGPRRAGKTYELFNLIKKLLKNNLKEQILYVNFERADINSPSDQDLIQMLESFFELYPENKKRKIWLFLDEIQNVSNWERFVRTAIDENIKVYLTGSSSKLLSKEIATSMRGRSLIYTIFPFSFKEYLKAKNFVPNKTPSSHERSQILNYLGSYLEYGGYPEAIIYESEREKIITNIKETAIYKDVIDRAKIRNTNALKYLITALINSKEFSVNKFYNDQKSKGIKIGKDVLYQYIDYLNEAFFVFPIRKYSHTYKESEQSIPKVYFIDNGILRISGINDFGRLMENLVFIELLRRNKSATYYKFTTMEEIDFVIKEDKKIKQLIQVCYDLSKDETKEREMKSLIMSINEFKCDELIILNWDFESEEKVENKVIKFIPLWKWLLNIN